MEKEKSEVYFNEYNVLMNNAVYLPLVSGLLQCYVQTIPRIRERYQFMPFIFIRDGLEKIVSQYKNPAVAAFSISMWNTRLSLEVARQIKEKFPKCLIVFGGANTPFDAHEFFQKYPFVDVTVRGEGEKTFANILEEFSGAKDFSKVPGISYRDKNRNCIRNTEECELPKDLDIFPSSYLEGAYDYLLANSTINFQAIIETNRGCPFNCAYCFESQGGLSKKFRFFSPERVKEIAEWCGKNKIDYIMCSDSNYGMFERDLELAGFFVEAKKKYGFPEKFRIRYGKNAEEAIYKIGKLLHEHGMEKGITLSKQTENPEALINIGRQNIKREVFDNLQKRYNRENIPTYTELILGLPGETYESFKEAVEQNLQTGIRNQLFVYHCQVYPNTKLADKEYQIRHGIVTKRLPLAEVHGAVRPKGITTEYEDVITATRTMPEEDWRKSTILAWIMQLFHGLKAGFYILDYLSDKYKTKYTDFFEYVTNQKNEGMLGKEIQDFEKAVDLILQNNSFCRFVPEFGPIYWEQEEASFLSISHEKEKFYEELFALIKKFLNEKGKDVDEEELREVVKYQKARMPDYKSLKEKTYYFKYNVPQYFENFFLENKSELSKTPQVMILDNPRNYDGHKETFAKESILWGRKSDKILYPIKWFEVD